MKRAALAFFLFAFLPAIAAAQQAGQAVPLDKAPDMSRLPWVLVFTPPAWQRDPLSLRLIELLDERTPLGAELRATTRFHVLPAGHPKTPDYSKFHGNYLPAVVVAAPQVKTKTDIWACIRRDGLAIATADEATLRDELLGARPQPAVSAETGEDEKIVGRPALLPRFWNDPPYICRPWLQCSGVNRDWDGSSNWYAGYSAPCPCRPRPTPAPSPAPPAPAPPPYGFGYGPQLHPDTTLTRHYAELLKERIAAKTGHAAGSFLGGLVGGASDAAGVTVAGLVAAVACGLIVGLVLVRLFSNAMQATHAEDDD